MDAHALRRIGLELASQLIDARIVSIYRPVPSSFVFKISKPALRPYLLFRYAPKAGFLFLSLSKPASPTTPDAVTMRLRKHLTGRRINGLWFNWQKPALCIGLAPRHGGHATRYSEYAARHSEYAGDAGDAGDAEHTHKASQASKNTAQPQEQAQEQNLELYLIFDLNLGPYLAGHLPDLAENLLSANQPRWEIKNALESLTWPDADLSKPWQLFPFLTPLLRKTLNLMDDYGEKLALLADLETATGDLFLYSSQDESLPMLSAWPLPKSLTQGQSEEVFASALQALEESVKVAAFTQINKEKNKNHLQDLGREKKLIIRALAKLVQEEEKLTGLIALKKLALSIQAQLYLWPQDAKLPEITLTHQGLPASNNENTANNLPIALDPQLSVRENMALMFKKAAKGERGLPHLARRRAELEEKLAQLEKLNASTLTAPENLQLKPGQSLKNEKAGQKKQLSQTKAKPNDLGKLISKFISPSGLTLLRGRNAKGNRQTLKMASPFDLWLHAQGGPSAHLIIKLPHPAFQIEDADLLEAARLVAEKSWQRDDSQARIICALAKDVHPIKGAAHGTVRVDKILRVIQL